MDPKVLKSVKKKIEEDGIAKSHADALEKRGIIVDHYLNPSTAKDLKKIKYYKRINMDIKKKFKSHISKEFTNYVAENRIDEIIEFSGRGRERNGQEWDKELGEHILHLADSRSEKPQKDVVDLFAKLEELYGGLEFIDSKFPLFGFMRDRTDDIDHDGKGKIPKFYLWQGEADAIAWYNGRYIIVDFKVVDNILDYWETATDLVGKHLHQCLIYARLLQLHMSLPDLPPSLIVVIDKVTGKSFYPPLFEDYPPECKERLYKGYDWFKTPPKKLLRIVDEKKLFRFSSGPGLVDPNSPLKDVLNPDAKVKDLLDMLGFESLEVV